MISHFQHKIHDFESIRPLSQRWKGEGQRVVFTNGCFDILHYGHLHYLAEAASLGDKLVIGLNSTASVRRLKGPSRPIHDDQTRLHMLAALECVHAVIIFEEDTPLTLIKVVMPDVLVKGGDWKVDQIVGAKEVLENGGTVKSLAFVEGYSTTGVIERIKLIC